MNLTEFLLARITEDEAVARRGSRHNAREVYANDNYGCLLVDPARVLAECEAKRRIVERCRPFVAVVWRESDRLLASAFDETHMPTLAHSAPIWPNEHAEATLRDLALPYSDHPDYDEAWRV